jgi:hypothetical protein
MATIFSANESTVMLNGEMVEGVRSLEYRRHQARTNVYALGTPERIGMTSGPQVVEGRLRIASTSPALSALDDNTPFVLTALLRQRDSKRTVTFDECFLVERTFEIAAGSHGEAVYAFTATRVREENA